MVVYVKKHPIKILFLVLNKVMRLRVMKSQWVLVSSCAAVPVSDCLEPREERMVALVRVGPYTDIHAHTYIISICNL